MAPTNKNKKPKQPVTKTARSSKQPKNSKVDVKPKSNESLILYYLTKLKSLFASSSESDVSVKTKKNPIKNGGVDNLTTSEGDKAIKENIYKVVNEAIEYGFRNKILERRGNCFLFRNNFRRYREAVPGSRSMKSCDCKRCAGLSPNYRARNKYCHTCSMYGQSKDYQSNFRPYPDSPNVNTKCNCKKCILRRDGQVINKV